MTIQPPNPSAANASHQAGSRAEFDIRDYWKIVRGGKWTILSVFTIVVGLVALWTFTQTPVYKATATILASTEVKKPLGGQDMTGMGVQNLSWTAEERFYNTQIEILRSRDLAQRVVDRMGLAADPMFQGTKTPAEILSASVIAVPRTDTQLIEVSYSGKDPRRITDIVNTVADEYVNRNLDKAKEGVKEILAEMNKQVTEFSKSTEMAERKRIGEAEANNLFVPQGQQDVLGRNLAQYMEERTRTKIDIGRLQAILDSVDSVQANGGDLLTIKDIADQRPVAELASQRGQLEKEIEGLRVKYLPSHPELKKKTSELDSVKEKLADQVNRIVSGYRAELNVKATLDRELTQNINTTRDQLFETGKNSAAYGLMSRDAEAKKRVYDAIQQKFDEILLTSGLLTNNIKVLDHAEAPRRPIRPRKVMNLFFGAVVGLLAGMGVVFALDHLDNTVKSVEDVEHGLQLPVLSIIPRYRETTGSAVKEAFQTLKTNIMFSSDGRKRTLLLLTSAGPREGKSSTVLNLARAMASGGERVVVVDCDLRRPTVHERFELERDHGLTNYLTEARGGVIDPYVKSTQTPNLFAITCGPIPPNPPELFASERFRDLLAELRAKFDWVIIDSPPVISLTDSVMLASMADMVAFVIKHNESEREMIKRCLRNIRNVDAHIIGAILNNIDIEKSYSKDYYYAGYYYNSPEDEEKKKKRSRSREVATGGASSS